MLSSISRIGLLLNSSSSGVAEIERARRVMQWYRDFLPQAPLDMAVFVGLKTVPSIDPFPKEIWAKKVVALTGACNGSAANPHTPRVARGRCGRLHEQEPPLPRRNRDAGIEAAADRIAGGIAPQ
jgi:hypothetical protein